MSTSLYGNQRNPGKKSVFTSPTPEPDGSRSIVHGRGRSTGGFDVGALDADEVMHVVHTVAKHGDLVSFSLTSDGGALVTCIKQNGIRHKCYAHTPEKALAAWTNLLAEVY